MALPRPQRHKFVLHLLLKYPLARKEAPSWLQFIQTQTGHLKKWNSVSASYSHAANKTHNAALKDARLERRAVAGLSPDTRAEQGSELSPEHEQLLARQVTEHCVCARMMAFECAHRGHY